MSRSGVSRRKDPRDCGELHSKRVREHRLVPPRADGGAPPCAQASVLRLPAGGPSECQSTCSQVWRYLPRRLLPSASANLFEPPQIRVQLSATRLPPPRFSRSESRRLWRVRRTVRSAVLPLSAGRSVPSTCESWRSPLFPSANEPSCHSILP